MRLPLALSVFFFLNSASAAPETFPKCTVVLVDSEGAQRLLQNPPPNATPEQLDVVAREFVRVLGEFAPKVGEEILTTRSFPLPDSPLMVTASVFYTDEVMPGDSISLALAVAERGFDNAMSVDGGSIAETNLTKWTYLVRVKKPIQIEARRYSLKLECECMSFAEYQRQATEYQQFKAKTGLSKTPGR